VRGALYAQRAKIEVVTAIIAVEAVWNLVIR
jgi:hypothetical protein